MHTSVMSMMNASFTHILDAVTTDCTHISAAPDIPGRRSVTERDLRHCSCGAIHRVLQVPAQQTHQGEGRKTLTPCTWMKHVFVIATRLAMLEVRAHSHSHLTYPRLASQIDNELMQVTAVTATAITVSAFGAFKYLPVCLCPLVRTATSRRSQMETGDRIMVLCQQAQGNKHAHDALCCATGLPHPSKCSPLHNHEKCRKRVLRKKTWPCFQVIRGRHDTSMAAHPIITGVPLVSTTACACTAGVSTAGNGSCG
jgi:hypothetical protein